MSDATEARRSDGIECHRFADDGVMPNNPVLPLIAYRAAVDLPLADPAAAFETRFGANGWGRAWRNGIFPFPHYHSTAHEVLGIARGEARVRLGGEAGLITTVRPGDVLVLPAGTGHQNLGATADFLVVGAYPPGPDWDLCYGRADERPRVLRNIASVPLPNSDPVHGPTGPLLTCWRAGGAKLS
jgi:uncharacterized protein YjlB